MVLAGCIDTGEEGPTERRPRILTPYRKGNHPQWLKAVDLLPALPDKVRRNSGLPIIYRLYRQGMWTWRLFRLSKKYDVILTGSDAAALFFGFAQRFFRRKRVPHIYLDFIINMEGARYKQALWRLLCRLAVDGASCAIVQRTCEVEAYSLALNLAVCKFCFIPYHATTFGVDLNVRDDGYIFAGGDAARDYPLLIKAVRGLPYRVVIAALQRSHFRNVEIPKNVEIVTVPGQEFLSLMAHASLIVVPLIKRPQHIGGQQTYLNAMTMGKPTIVTDLEARDYIANDITGILTPPGNATALRESIRRVMEDWEFAHSLGHRAKQASHNYTPEKFFAAVLDLCTRYTAGPP